MSILNQLNGFWTGVVEDRMDPLFLGRCRVRVMGIHTADRAELPTEHLPWAVPMQPINSAAMNGIGTSPLGPVEGTHVVGFFRDGDECQEPVILGTLGGIPQPETPRYQAQNTPTLESTIGTVDGNQQVDSRTKEPAKAAPITTTPKATGVIGPLTEEDLDSLFTTLRQRESSNNYAAINNKGYVGAYQFGALRLIDLGYIKSGAQNVWANLPKTGGSRGDFAADALEEEIIEESLYETVTDTSRQHFNFYCLATDSVWSSKANGSAESFINSRSLQDRAIRESFENNYRQLVRMNIVDSSTTREQVGGYLFTAHLLGCGGVRDMVNGVDKADGNNVYGSEYYNIGYRAIKPTAVEQTLPPPTADIADASPKTNREFVQKVATVGTIETVGFTDPNKKYPRKEHIGEPDTNRLARHQKVAQTIVDKKDRERIQDVPCAIDEPKWDQPLVPYNAKYPYNHTYESESGHVVEYDDTPGQERIHQYHRKGTFYEIDRNGTRVTRIVGDEYTILERNGFLYVQGKMNVTIDGPCNILVKNDCNLEVGGDLKTHVHKNYELNVAGKIQVVAGSSIDFKAGGNINTQSGRNVNIKSTNSMKLESKKTSVKGKDSLGLDGKNSTLKATSFKVGATSFRVKTKPTPFAVVTGGSGASAASTSRVVPAQSPQENRLPPLTVPTRTEEQAFAISSLSEHPKENSEIIKKEKQALVDSGVATPQQLKAEPLVTATDDKPVPTKAAPVVTECSDLEQLTDFPPTMVFTKDYTLGSVSTSAAVSKYAVVAQHGLTKAQIVCNLRAVVKNCLQPIRDQYPNVFVSSGFRTPGNSTATAGISQHEKGEALDLQFRGASKEEYYEIAQWIRDHIPFDQCLLEYKNTPNENPWIHISFKRSGNRNTVSTFFNHATAPGGAGTLLRIP
jgi:hypothetical protein